MKVCKEPRVDQEIWIFLKNRAETQKVGGQGKFPVQFNDCVSGGIQGCVVRLQVFDDFLH